MENVVVCFHNIKQVVLAENDEAISFNSVFFFLNSAPEKELLWDLQAAFQFVYLYLTLTVEQNAESCTDTIVIISIQHCHEALSKLCEGSSSFSLLKGGVSRSLYSC